MKMRILAVASIAVFLILALFPFPTKATGKASIRLIDETGSPVDGAAVYRSWEHYGLHQRGSSEYKSTDKAGEVAFEEQTVSGSVFRRILPFLLSLVSPHVSTGARPHFEIYCPVGYELRLSEPDFSPIKRTGEFASSRSKHGDALFIDFSPPHPKSTSDYSVRVCLYYRRASSIDFTLPVRRVGDTKK